MLFGSSKLPFSFIKHGEVLLWFPIMTIAMRCYFLCGVIWSIDWKKCMTMELACEWKCLNHKEDPAAHLCCTLISWEHVVGMSLVRVAIRPISLFFCASFPWGALPWLLKCFFRVTKGLSFQCVCVPQFLETVCAMTIFKGIYQPLPQITLAILMKRK